MIFRTCIVFLIIITSTMGYNRIVSLSPVIGEIIHYFNQEAKVVGVDSKSYYLKYPDTVKNIGRGDNPDISKIKALQPDIVIGVGSPTDSLVYKLRAHGMKTLIFPYPNTFDDLFQLMRILGVVFDIREEAHTAIGKLMAQIDELQKTRPKINPGFAIIIEYPPLIAATPRTFMHHIVTLAGGANVVNPGREYYTKLRIDYLMRKNPEVVLVTNPDLTKKIISDSPIGVTRAAKLNHVLDEFPRRLLLVPSPNFIEAVQYFRKVFESYVYQYYKP